MCSLHNRSEARGAHGRSIQEKASSNSSTFLRMLAKDSKHFKGTEAPYSELYPFYALSFFLMIWPLAIAILMAIIYAIVTIRRSRDGKVLRIP